MYIAHKITFNTDPNAIPETQGFGILSISLKLSKYQNYIDNIYPSITHSVTVEC